MIKVNKKMMNRFLEIMDEYNEFVFGDDDYLKQQLEICLNNQGYWAGCYIIVFYDKYMKDFYVESSF